MRLGPDFRRSQVILLFLQHVSLTLPADFGKVLLALILDGNSKSHVFEKIYT